VHFASTFAFRPDGRQAAGVSNETVLLWDTATGKRERDVTYRPENRVSNNSMECLAYSSDSKFLAAGTAYSDVVVWDTSTYARGVLRGHTSTVYAVAFRPDGKILATGSADDTVRLWDLTSGGHTVLRGHRGWVSHLAFRPDGKRLLSAGRDRTIRLWDVASGRQLALWRGHDATIHSLAFSPDGTRFASLDDDGPVKVWDAAAPSDAWPEALTAVGLTDLAHSPDGTSLAVARVSNWSNPDGSLDAEVLVCDAATGQVRRCLERFAWHREQGSDTPLIRLAFSHDGRRLAAVRVALRGTGIRGETSVPDPATVRVWDVSDGREVFTLEKAGEHVAFSPDGRWIATLALPRADQALMGGPIHFWDAATGRLVFTYTQNGEGGRRLAFSPEGRTLALTGQRVTLLRVGADGLELLRSFDHSGECLAFSPDGRFLATSTDPAEVCLWDVRSPRLIREINERRHSGHSSAGGWALLSYTPNRVAFSPDSRLLVYATDNDTIAVQDVASGQDLLELDDLPTRAERVLFTPDGRLLAVDSQPRWQAWDGRPLPDEVALKRLVRLRVNKVYYTVRLKDEVLARLRDDPDLSPAARRMALARAEQMPESAKGLYAVSWEVVRAPGADEAAYRLALRQAEAACRLEPGEPDYLNILGVALYRNRKYREAIDTLRRAQALRPEAERERVSEDLAYLAMSHHRLGETAQAQDYLRRLRRLKSEKRDLFDQADFVALLRETEELIEGKAKP
jgi:WD40 repeat protein